MYLLIVIIELCSFKVDCVPFILKMGLIISESSLCTIFCTYYLTNITHVSEGLKIIIIIKANVDWYKHEENLLY